MSGKYNMEISQGSDFKLSLSIKDSNQNPVDLTGHTFRGQIRKTASDAVTQATFTFTITDAVNGAVDVELPAADSSAIALGKSKNAARTITTMTYDIESEDASGNVTRWLEGLVKFSPEVTK